VITYTTLIDVLGKAGQWRKAQSALLRMQEDGLVPDRVLYNVVADALGEAGKLVDVTQHMAKMKAAGHKPDQCVCNRGSTALFPADAEMRRWGAGTADTRTTR